MAYYNKIGLLILNSDQTKFMVCEPGSLYEDKKVVQYLMPGGQLELGENDVQNLTREIKEELDCGVDEKSLKLIGEYTDIAASGQGRDVMIRLYLGKIIGDPVPSSEIGAFHWIGKSDVDNSNVSPITKNKIIPDLVEKGILK